MGWYFVWGDTFQGEVGLPTAHRRQLSRTVARIFILREYRPPHSFLLLIPLPSFSITSSSPSLPSPPALPSPLSHPFPHDPVRRSGGAL